MLVRADVRGHEVARVALHVDRGRSGRSSGADADGADLQVHVGGVRDELRVLLGPAHRGKGLGRLLVQECFAMALGLGLEKLVVQMTIDQRTAIAAFEGLGFRAEALLRNHVKDSDGMTHDLALLSHDVGAVQSMMQVYGVPDALGQH